MHDSLLLKVIHSLNKKQFKNFERLLEAPYFMSASGANELFQLWKLIKKGLTKSNIDYLDKANIYVLLYPGQPVLKGKLEKLMSLLLKQIHRFLVLEDSHMDEKSVAYQLVIFKHYIKNGLGPEAMVKAKLLHNQQTKVKTTVEQLYNKFLYEQFVAQYGSLKSNRKDDLNLTKTVEQLDNFYLFTKLEYAVQLLSINQWITPLECQEVLEGLDLNLQRIPDSLQENQVFSLYLIVYKLLKDFQLGNAQLFKAYLEKLEDFKAECTEEQIKAFQTLARNYCIHFYHQGDDEFIKIGYTLYQDHLKEGLLHHKGKMLLGTFRNLVLLGIWNEDYKWVEEFIEDHKDRIRTSDDNNLVYNIHRATLEFYRSSYDKALELLSFDITDQYLKLAARRLEIMIHYELQSPIFTPKLEAYKIYVYRMTEAVHLKKSKDRNRSFVDILKQIQHPKTYRNSARIDKLIKKIRTTSFLIEKPWLLEKLEEKRN